MRLLGLYLSLNALSVTHQLMINNYIVDIEKNTLVSVKSTYLSDSTLDLSGLSIYKIDPNCFAKVGNIENLTLANNKLSRLPYMAFRDLPHLQYLSLANNRLKYMQYAFSNLPFLQKLDIRNNTIDYLDTGSFYGLNNAVNILIDGNHFGNIESRHFRKPCLTLSVCMINGIVQSLDVVDEANEQENAKMNCTMLYRELKDDEVRLTAEGIEGFKKGWYRIDRLNVKSLDFDINGIDIVTEDLFNDLPATITEVNLGFNNIRSLKKGIIRNKNLLKLDLGYNRIDEIEDYALLETGLTNLVLRGNKLRNLSFVETLPSTLASLTLPGITRLAECRTGF